MLIEVSQPGQARAPNSPAAPIVLLQSMTRASLCFVALPLQAVDRGYQLAIAPEDLADLGLATGRQPELGAEVLALALLSLHDDSLATANLMAPVVLNVKTRRGLQAIRRDSRYSHQHPVAAQAAQAARENVPEGAC